MIKIPILKIGIFPLNASIASKVQQQLLKFENQ
jgi:hypothetical protein